MFVFSKSGSLGSKSTWKHFLFFLFFLLIFLRLYPKCLFHLSFLSLAHCQDFFAIFLKYRKHFCWLNGIICGYPNMNSQLPLVILSKCIVNNVGNSWACKRASQSPGIGYRKCSGYYTASRFIVQLHRVWDVHKVTYYPVMRHS